MSGAQLTIPRLDPGEGHFRIPSSWDGLSLFLRYLPASRRDDYLGAKKIVLYVHNATSPSAVSIAHRLAGRSWRDELVAAGFHVWGMDFLGYGNSDRFPQMTEPAGTQASLGRADDASRQIESAVRFIRSWHQAERISLIAHSWGCIAAGCFTSRCPEFVERLLFFAPIACRNPQQPTAPESPAWRLMTVDDQWARFTADVPPGEAPVILKRLFDEWAERYLDTDCESRNRHPPAVKIPAGPLHDIHGAWAGKYPYDPATILAPVAIVRGQWDSWCTDADAHGLFDALKQSPVKRQVILSRGTHQLHLEENRYALYREAQTFLTGEGPVSKAALPYSSLSRP